jgi:hypothetical protein
MNEEEAMNPQPPAAQQNPQVLAGELNQPGAQDLLTTATLVRLAYNGPDGLPRVIPIGFLWNGSQVVVCT